MMPHSDRTSIMARKIAGIVQTGILSHNPRRGFQSFRIRCFIKGIAVTNSAHGTRMTRTSIE